MNIFKTSTHLSSIAFCLALTACGGGGGSESSNSSQPTINNSSSSLNVASVSSSSLNAAVSSNSSVISSTVNPVISSSNNSVISSKASSIPVSSKSSSSAQSIVSSAVSSSSSKSSASSQNEIAPSFVTFIRVDTGDLVTGHNLVVEATCNNCDASGIVYTWFFDGNQKATGNTYQLTDDDVGRNIRVKALAYSPNHTKTVESELNIAMVTPSLVKLERLDTGDLIPGQKLIVKAQCKGCLPDSLAYNWYVDDVLVGNGDNYLIKQEDQNKTIHVDAVTYLFTGTPHQRATMEFKPVFVVDAFSNSADGYPTTFATLKNDGTAVIWGDFIQDEGQTLSGVKTLLANQQAVTFLKQDNTVVTYNSSTGDFTSNNLSNVKSIAATVFAFAALKQDGTVTTWGSKYWGGAPEITEYTSPAVPVTLTNIKSIIGNERSFVGLRNNGTLVVWGSWEGTEPQSEISDVKQVFATVNAYAAIKNDNSVVTFGQGCCGGDSTGKILTNIKTIYSTRSAFAALTNDGSVVTWGKASDGGDSSGKDLSGISSIAANLRAFAALKNDGRVITWGDSTYGADGGGLDLTNVKQITGYMQSAFLALKNDGSVVIWGNGYNPGKILYSSGVTEIVQLSSGGALIKKSDGSIVVEPYQGASDVPENALSRYTLISNTHP